MAKIAETRLARREKTQREIAGDAAVAGIWFAFYLIAVGAALISPQIASGIGFATLH
jgi:hypothetical protein